MTPEKHGNKDVDDEGKEEGMKKSVMLISSSKFAARPLVRQLQNERLQAICVSPVEQEILEHFDEVSIIIFLLDEGIYNEEKLFGVLRDLMWKHGSGHYLCLCGTKAGISIAEGRLPGHMIAYSQERPFDVSEMLDELLPRIARDEHVSAKSLLNRKKSILLVDDDTTFLRMMQAWLGPFYRVTAVTDGAEALSFLMKRKVDLVLLDYEMPGMSGPDTLKQIRMNRSNKNLPVIFLTGKDDRESIMKVLAYHPTDYLLKSNGREVVLKKLLQFFGEQEHDS